MQRRLVEVGKGYSKSNYYFWTDGLKLYDVIEKVFLQERLR